MQYLAIVGDGLPDVLALGAAINPPPSLIIAAAILLLGIRTATVSSPPVVSSGIRSDLLRIIVSGPGQKAFASLIAASGTSDATLYRSSTCQICTIRGLSDGLPLAAYIFFEESGFLPSPPSPYTVSVGKATRPPSRRICPAFFNASFAFSSILFSSITTTCVSTFISSYLLT